MLLTKLLGLPENQAKHRTSVLTAIAGLSPRIASSFDPHPGGSVASLPRDADLSPDERAVSEELRKYSGIIATDIGRNVFHPQELRRCEDAMWGVMSSLGEPRVAQEYPCRGVQVKNFELAFEGAVRPEEIVVIGAHYDSVELKDEIRERHRNCPGANDNGSGVVATLSLARLMRDMIAGGRRPDRTVRFVLFANEEPPFFWTPDMGSRRYADECWRRREKIVGMLTPETMGYFTDEAGSQRLPLGIGRAHVGDKGNWLGFMGLSGSRAFMRTCTGAFRRACTMRCVGAELPAMVPMVGASDHWSFWRRGYPALMVTDTAPFRYNYYHQWLDGADKMHWPGFARAVCGLWGVVRELASVR
jgi:hypothetical protein